VQQLHGERERLVTEARKTKVTNELQVEALSADLALARQQILRIEQSVTVQLFRRLSDRLYGVIGQQSLLARGIQASLRLIGRVFTRRGDPSWS
jgi:hypothetical protein